LINYRGVVVDVILAILFLVSLGFFGASLGFSGTTIFTVFTTSFDILSLEGSGEEKRHAISRLFSYTKLSNSFDDYVSTFKRACRINGFTLFGYLLSLTSFILLEDSFLTEVFPEPIFSFSSYFFNPLLFLVIPVIFWCISKAMVASNWTNLDYFLELKH